MRKLAKIALWTIGVVAVLLVAAAVGLKLYLTKERILAWVIPPLEERLRREVSVADAGLGWGGVHLDGLEIRSAGAEKPLIAAETLRIRWDLWALLSRRVEIGEVRLVKPSVHLVRLPDGKLEVADLLGPPPRPQERAGPAGEPSAGPPLAVGVGVISVEGGQVAFEDRARKPARTYTVREIETRVTEISLDRPLRYELSARLPLAEAGRLSVEGTVDPGTADVVARARIRDVELASLNPLMEGGPRFGSGRAEVGLDMELAGGRRAALSGKLAVRRLELASQAGAGRPTDITVTVDATVDMDGGTVSVPRLDAEAAGQKLHAEGTVTGLQGRPRADFRVESEELRVDALGALMPPGEQEGAAVPGPQPRTGPAAEAVPGVPLDAVVDVRVARLLAGGLALEGFAARVELEKGRLRVRPAEAEVAQGKLTLDAGAELQKPGPPFEVATSLSGSQVGQLLAAANPKLKDAVTGVVSLTLEAQGVGSDVKALRAETRAEARDGKIVNHPLALGLASLFEVKEFETLNFYALRAEAAASQGVGTLRSLVLDGPNLRATGSGTFGLLDRGLDIRLAVAIPREIAAKLIPSEQTLGAVTDGEGWTRLPLRLEGSVDQPSYGLDSEALTAEARRVLGDKAQRALEEKVLKKIPLREEETEAIRKGLKGILGR